MIFWCGIAKNNFYLPDKFLLISDFFLVKIIWQCFSLNWISLKSSNQSLHTLNSILLYFVAQPEFPFNLNSLTFNQTPYISIRQITEANVQEYSKYFLNNSFESFAKSSERKSRLNLFPVKSSLLLLLLLLFFDWGEVL